MNSWAIFLLFLNFHSFNLKSANWQLKRIIVWNPYPEIIVKNPYTVRIKSMISVMKMLKIIKS